MSILTKLFLLSISVVGLFSCIRNKPIIYSNQENIESASVLRDKFEVAFKHTSTDLLEQILADWNQTIPPNTAEFIQHNDTIKAVFEVYKEIYKPYDLQNLGNWEFGNRLNKNSEYIVIQNKIEFSISNKDEFSFLVEDGFDDLGKSISFSDSITNFRPPVSLDRRRILYLTKEYKEALNQFLGRESTELGSPNLMTPSQPKEDSDKRYRFIRPYIPILHGHWGGYWHLETHPMISEVIFNETMSLATVMYRVGYQGGMAILEKKGNKWKIKKADATWIE